MTDPICCICKTFQGSNNLTCSFPGSFVECKVRGFWLVESGPGPAIEQVQTRLRKEWLLESSLDIASYPKCEQKSMETNLRQTI
jgi:hypothetical protein